MRKFLIMLMAVAMVSFLFVGCNWITPPDPDPGEQTEAPIINKIFSGAVGVAGYWEIDLDTLDTQYMNEEEVTAATLDGISVTGFAVKGSIVSLYINGDLVDTNIAALTEGTKSGYGNFTLSISIAELDKDEVKTIYATAKELGLAESADSTSYGFTLDTEGPEIEKVAFVVEVTPLTGTGTITVTFDEALKEDTVGVETEEEAGVDCWSVINHTDVTREIRVKAAKSTSDNKVVKLDVTYGGVGGVAEVDDEIKVICVADKTTIKDLAGNLAIDSYGYCEIELAD